MPRSTMVGQPGFLLQLLLLAAISYAEPLDPGALPAALAEDDECKALSSEGGAAGAAPYCSLSALQLRSRAEAQSLRVAHSALSDSLGRIGEAVRSWALQSVHGGQPCDEASRSFAQCFPARMIECSTMGNCETVLTGADIKQVCACQGFVQALKQCPTLASTAAALLPMLKQMCEPCAEASFTLVFNAACMTHAPNGTLSGFDESAACGPMCRPLACAVLQACPEGTSANGMPADSMREMRTQLARSTQSCKCAA